MRLTSFLLSTMVVSLVLWACLLPVDARAELMEEEVVVCEPDCGEKQCGEDGCGGSCGVCSPYELCQAGECSFNGGCQPLAVPGCGQCACESCTCALDPYCCTGKWDALCVARCGSQCGGCGTKVECGDGLCNGGEDCSNCITDCGICSPSCGPITSVGCCAETTLLACQNGTLAITNCLTDGSGSCGWDPVEEQYGCGGVGADPAGNHSLLCPAPPIEDVVEEIVLPEACNGLSFIGCCDDSFLRWCDSGGLHSLDCGSNLAPYDQCGWNLAKGYYDCGGEGGDPSGAASPFCPTLQIDVVVDDLVAPECKVGTLVAEGCETIPWEGCCDDGGALFFCEAGTLLCKLDCSGLVYPSNTCGWHAGQPGYYDCGGEGGDPIGEFPYACPQTEVPEDVTIQEFTSATCTDVPEKGCCDGAVLQWCENGIVRDFDCGDLVADPVFGDYLYCGSNPATGAADCLKKPDPSPPECVVETPETPVEEVPDGGLWPLESPPELVAQPELTQGEVVNPEMSTETFDGSGLVFPPDGVEEPEPKSGKDGCAVGPRPSSTSGWLLLAALALLLLAAVRKREAS
jgi:MYXO-CTERM domain-containing protein